MVEVAGIEPASNVITSGILRAQPQFQVVSRCASRGPSQHLAQVTKRFPLCGRDPHTLLASAATPKSRKEAALGRRIRAYYLLSSKGEIRCLMFGIYRFNGMFKR